MLCSTPAVCHAEGLSVSAAAAVVMHESGELLYEKNARTPMLIASTTKLMTALVACEECAADTGIVILPEDCAVEGSSMYLRAGESYTLYELLEGLLLASGNDAACAIARAVSGSVEAFAQKMNERAALLGMEHSHFVNPHGLNAEEHYSCALDLARLMLACADNALLREILTLPTAEIHGLTYANHNKLLSRLPGCLGGKTGYTMAAGRCLVSCCEREGTRLVCVTLQDPKDWDDHCRLYEMAFSEVRTQEVSIPALFVPLIGEEEGRASVELRARERILLRNGEELSLRWKLPEFIFPPVAAGERAGTLYAYKNGVLCGEWPLYYTGEELPGGMSEEAMRERIQKIIAASGLMSRRSAEEAIAAGRVTVNGETAVLGMQADAGLDRVLVDGKGLPAVSEKRYIMLHKPKGYVTTMHDEKNRKDVTMLLSEVGCRVYPVGRLDMYSEGLLILTNDGEAANRLMHPRHEIDKTYETWVTGEDIGMRMEFLREPMELDGYLTHGADVELLELYGNGAKLAVTIHEGRNRQVRRMCEAVGLHVTKLRRVREGELTLGDLPCGAWRDLTEEEIAWIRG